LPAPEEPPPNWLIWNTVRWLPLIERWHPDFPELDPALVLAVMAQESQGNPYAEAGDGWGSVGLMQVIPRNWTGTRTQLLNPAYNIYVGMRMLDFSTQKWGVRLGLAHYNCSEEGVRNDACGSKGGLNYADRILEYWMPVFKAELFVLASDNEWLASLGYQRGYGRWDTNIPEEEQEFGCRIVIPQRRLRPRICIQ